MNRRFNRDIVRGKCMRRVCKDIVISKGTSNRQSERDVVRDKCIANNSQVKIQLGLGVS